MGKARARVRPYILYLCYHALSSGGHHEESDDCRPAFSHRILRVPSLTVSRAATNLQLNVRSSCTPGVP